MKKSLIFLVIISGALLGLFLSLSFAGYYPLSSNYPLEELEAKDALLKDFLDEQSYLQSRIVFLREEIEEAQKEVETQTETSNLSLLESLKEDVGLSEIRGKGLEIILEDSPLAVREGVDVAEIDLVQASDIRDIINVLFAANADAISVNNQRVIATSPITSVGTTILVNNSYIAPPFTISAVGDFEMMLERLLNEPLLASLYERSSKYNIVFQISVKDWITVPIYNGDLKANYLTLIN